MRIKGRIKGRFKGGINRGRRVVPRTRMQSLGDGTPDPKVSTRSRLLSLLGLVKKSGRTLLVSDLLFSDFLLFSTFPGNKNAFWFDRVLDFAQFCGFPDFRYTDVASDFFPPTFYYYQT